ncbi:hypothetical protein PR048_005949 [Dryococelus australis]|uniref:Uncharacterized protein n=1 Tax=Dryococelus australis TaxID=614101 RepID=A0ABQ9I9L4_9NEOP|nr:hypothetical protein PR048_005949 [Dryococelus australis]
MAGRGCKNSPDNFCYVRETQETPAESEGKCEDSGDGFLGDTTSSEPQLFTQMESNYLIRDLGLHKESAQFFGSRLKKKN